MKSTASTDCRSKTAVPAHSLLQSVPPFAWVLATSAAAWLLLFIALPPALQNFPLSDDWAFAHGAFAFARGEGIHYSNWASMPQLGQWLWAYPFLCLLGETYFALRVSTIFISWLGLWAFYDLLQQGGASRGKACFAAAVLAANPVFFMLQGTFMTDVPALSLALLSLALYVRALQGGHAWLGGACAVGVLAAVTRQTTVTVPLVAAILFWREQSLRKRWQWWLAVSLPIACGLSAHLWFQSRPDVVIVEPRPLGPANLLLFPYLILHFCGLSVLPLLLLERRIGSWRVFVGAAVVMLACAGYWFKIVPRDGVDVCLFPYTGSFLTPWGHYAADLVPGQAPVLMDNNFRMFLTLAGCLAGAALFVRLVAWRRQGRTLGPLLLFSLLQIPFILVAPVLWDRYMLGLMPGAFFLIASPLEGQVNLAAESVDRWRKLRWLTAASAALVFGAASVSLMHDWLAWNSARWELGWRAIKNSIYPLEIEGGMEWNGAYSAPYQLPQRRKWRDIFTQISRKAGRPKGLTHVETRVWFPQITGRYALSHSPLPDGIVVDTQPYKRWLMSGNLRFYLIEWAPKGRSQGKPNQGAASQSP